MEGKGLTPSINSDALYIDGGKSGDTINLISSKSHTVYGGKGDDNILSGSTKALFIDGGADHDTINLTGSASNGNAHTIDGNSGNDSITGTDGEELIDGGTEDDGNDTLTSGGGDDTIYGRSGNDLISLQAGIDAGIVRVQAGAGDDVIEVTLNELTYKDIINGEKGADTIAVVGSPADFNMWEPNTVAEKAFDSISGVETLAFGTQNTSYTVAGTKTIQLSSAVQNAGVLTIDASNVTGAGDDVLEVDAFLFSSSAGLTFIGSDDKDVNVNFTGGSGDDTFTTGKITEDAGDSFTGGLGEDIFNIIATDQPAVITDLGTGGQDTIIINNLAAGVTATVKADYIAPETTQNDNATLSNVVLNAESGVDVNMSDAGGTFGFVINGGQASSVLQGSQFHDSITGNVRSDELFGNGGNDTFTGGGGADIIRPGKGNGYV